MKKSVATEEIVYVSPQIFFLNLSIEKPILDSSNEGIGDDDDI